MQPGTVVGDRWVIERLAGEGGMGAVYRAIDRRTKEPAAVKVIQGASSGARARFAREARLLAELEHPGIVRYLGEGTDASGAPFLVMEWLEGEDLAARLERGALSVAESLAVGRAIAGALAAVHARGVVHRDVKPSNVFLVDGAVDRLKVIDFGVARVTRGTRARSLTGEALGTPGYMAPEQARGERSLDARADVFATGCVLFECLTGTPAFHGEHVMAVLAKILFADAPRLAELLPGIDPRLDDLVARSLSKVAGARPRDGAELAGELALCAVREGEAVPAAAPSLTHGERRVISVVLLGFEASGLDARLGTGSGGDATLPLEGAGSRLLDLRRRVADAGGRLEPLADGSLVAVLEGDLAAGDQARAAARCALALRADAEGPIALATGRAVMGGRVPLGEVIDRAVATLRGASGAAVFVDEVTAGLLDTAFDVAERDGRRVLERERSDAEPARTLLGRTTPFVGREGELALLTSIFEKAVDDPVARAVLITAPAGTGKSRLRAELVRSVRASFPAARVLLGRGDAMRRGAALGILGDAVRFALAGSEPSASELLCELAGLPVAAPSPALRAARRDPMLLRDGMERAFVKWLADGCAQGPVLLALEDLHWGDAGTVAFVDAALRALHDRPFFVLALARPEVHALFPGLWRGRGLQEVGLGELPRRAGERLVRAVLEEASEATITRIVALAAGNAFFLEELIRGAAERGVTDAPPTVLAVLEARLSALSPESRRVLRAASLFGEAFWHQAVVAVLGGRAASVADVLRELEARELVARRAVSRLAGEEELAFRHALVRDAAYAMLTEEDRVLGHRLAAEWLERAGEPQPAIVAEHLERGNERAAAARWYVRAARHAVGASDSTGVAAWGARARACGVSGEDLGLLLLVEAEVERWRGDLQRARDLARQATEILPRRGAAWYAAAGELAFVAGRMGDLDAGLALFGDDELSDEPDAAATQRVAWARLVEFALHGARVDVADALLAKIDREQPLPDPSLAGWILRARGWRACYSWALDAPLRQFLAAARAFEEAGHRRLGCLQRVHIGGWLIETGAYRLAMQLGEPARDEARELGAEFIFICADTLLGLARLARGELDDARSIEASIDKLRAQRDRVEGAARLELARLLLARDDIDGAEHHIRLAHEFVLRQAPGQLGRASAVLARVLVRRGRAAEALALARDASTRPGARSAELYAGLAMAEALEAMGDREAAARERARLTVVVEERASACADPEIRAGFMAMPECVALRVPRPATMA